MKLLLFSGGVESTCLALMHNPDLLLTIDYGHKSAEGELRTSSFIANHLKMKHETLEASINSLGTGDLVGEAPLDSRKATEFWPFRNQFLITLASMKCAKDGFNEILIGTVSTDSIHEDGTKNFIEAMNRVLQQQMPTLSVSVPAIEMNTLELVKSSGISKNLLGWTFSCHKENVACGQCRGCAKTIELLHDLDETGCQKLIQ